MAEDRDQQEEQQEVEPFCSDYPFKVLRVTMNDENGTVEQAEEDIAAFVDEHAREYGISPPMVFIREDSSTQIVIIATRYEFMLRSTEAQQECVMSMRPDLMQQQGNVQPASAPAMRGIHLPRR